MYRLRWHSVVVMFLWALTPQSSHAQFLLEDAFPNLRFRAPVDLQHPADATNRLFVAEQRGVISVFENSSTTATAEVFLDISDRVLVGGELGLLGLAFHPDYDSNGYFFVNYTAANPRRTIVARYQANPPTATAVDPATELVLLEVPQPYSNHNAGQLVFGTDGYLYIALGDGGSGGDPDNNGQDPTTLLGSILRIDVSHSEIAEPYRIPPDNPFVGDTSGSRPEIFAYGLRNPWRFSVDPETGDIWAGDVGQGTREEIDLILKGRNYGWNIMEGTICYNPSVGCDTTGLTLPIFDYGRSEGSSITGGYVYRGTAVPELIGKYIYGDFGSGRIWALTIDGAPENRLLLDSPLAIASFGIDAWGELYVLEYKDPGAAIYRLSGTTQIGSVEPIEVPRASRLLQNYPNPFNPSTIIPFELSQGGSVRIEIFDIQGRLLSSLSPGTLGAGRHTVRWDSDNRELRARPSGTYYYRLVLDGRVVDTQSLILLR